MVVYAAIDMVEASALPDGNRGLLTSYLFKLPSVLVHVLPLALVIGVQLTLAALRRLGEWDAMRSVGMSQKKLMATLLIVPFCSIFLSLALTAEIAPRALGIWQQRFDDSAAPDSGKGEVSGWFKKDGMLVRVSGGPEIVIERDPLGQPSTFFYKPKGTPDDRAQVWRRGRGWQEEAQIPDVATGSLTQLKQALLTTTTALPGASLTIGALVQAIGDASKMGLPGDPLMAELALRVALIAACLVIPLLSLGVSLLSESKRATRLVGLGFIAALTYWLLLTTAWNGAMMGIWSPVWVSAGVPLLFLACGAGLALLSETSFRFTA